VALESSTGSFGLRTVQGGVAGSLGEGGYRASVADLRFDGFRTNPLDGASGTFGEARRTIVNATATLPVGGGTLRAVFNGLDMAADNPGSLSQELLDEGDRQAFRFNVLQQTREDILQGQLGLTWNGRLGALDGQVGVWGIRRDFLGAIPPAVVEFDRNAGGVRALFEGGTETPLGLLTLGGGVEVELQSDDRRNWDNDGGERGALSLDQDERVRSTGTFAQARLDVSGSVALLGGLRWDRFRFEADDRFRADGSDDSGSRTMDAVSPSAGLVVDPAPGLQLFASVATSFETPTTTELTNRPDGSGGFNPELDPTRGLSVEGGVRGRLGDGWFFEATAYRTSLDEELIPFEVPAQPGRTFFRNAGESRHTGFEVTLDGRLAPEMPMRVAYTRVNGRFEAYEVEGEDFSGNRLPGIAPNRLDGRVAWEPQGLGFVELRGLWQDDVPVNDANTASSPSYFLADVRGGLEGIEAGGVVVAPWAAVTNVLDRRYNTAVTVNAFGGRYFEPGPGRSVRVGLRLTWDTR
jgi:iron complex outermembrane receptor protein